MVAAWFESSPRSQPNQLLASMTELPAALFGRKIAMANMASNGPPRHSIVLGIGDGATASK
jgi:hypothetical protein